MWVYGINLFFSALSIFHLIYLGSLFDLDAEDEKVPAYRFLYCLLIITLHKSIVNLIMINVHCIVVIKEK